MAFSPRSVSGIRRPRFSSSVSTTQAKTTLLRMLVGEVIPFFLFVRLLIPFVKISWGVLKEFQFLKERTNLCFVKDFGRLKDKFCIVERKNQILSYGFQKISEGIQALFNHALQVYWNLRSWKTFKVFKFGWQTFIDLHFRMRFTVKISG